MNTMWILRIACMLQLASMGILFAFDAVRMKDMGVGESAIGLILGLSSGVFIFSSLFWGRLADRHQSHRSVVIWGSVGTSLLLAYFSFSRTTGQFFIYGALKGILLPMIAGMMSAMAVQAVGRKNAGSRIGVYRAFGSLGFILGTMGLPVIFDDLGTIARAAAVILFASTLLVLRLPQQPRAEPQKHAPLRLREAHPALKLFLASYFFVALGEPSVHSFFSAYARELGASTRLLGMLSGTMGFVALISLPLIGRSIDRIHPAYVLCLSFFAQPTRVFLISLIDDPHFLWIPILLHGVCWGGIEVCAIVYLSSLVRKTQRATVLAYYMAMRMTGFLVGAAASGWLAENIGYTAMFRIMTLATLVGAIAYATGVLGFGIGTRRTGSSALRETTAE